MTFQTEQHFIEQAELFLTAATDVCMKAKTADGALQDVLLLYQANVPFARILCCVYLSPAELVNVIRGNAQDLRTDLIARIKCELNERSEDENG